MAIGKSAECRADKAEAVKPVVKRRPRFVVEAVELLAANTSDGKVHLSALRHAPSAWLAVPPDMTTGFSGFCVFSNAGEGANLRALAYEAPLEHP